MHTFASDWNTHEHIAKTVIYLFVLFELLPSLHISPLPPCSNRMPTELVAKLMVRVTSQSKWRYKTTSRKKVGMRKN